MLIRPRRLRRSEKIRNMVAETEVCLSHLVQPYFLSESSQAKEPIQNFTNQFRWGIEPLSKKIETDLDRGLTQFLLFGTTLNRDPFGISAYSPESVLATSIRALKNRFGKNVVLFSDVCLCPYTSHGHCGIVKDDGVDNDSSNEALAKVALMHAQMGVDFVAPSDMMDGRVSHIRKTLDSNGFEEVGILSYTAKYASHYYGPFREAVSSPRTIDRASYQMDYRNASEALRELRLDETEGADIVMVKPALAYLDIIRLFKENTELPVAAYSVSGEYEMQKLFALKQMADERALVIENLSAIRRAGAKLIMSYYTSEIAEKGWI